MIFIAFLAVKYRDLSVNYTSGIFQKYEIYIFMKTLFFTEQYRYYLFFSKSPLF